MTAKKLWQEGPGNGKESVELNLKGLEAWAASQGGDEGEEGSEESEESESEGEEESEEESESESEEEDEEEDNVNEEQGIDDIKVTLSVKNIKSEPADDDGAIPAYLIPKAPTRKSEERSFLNIAECSDEKSNKFERNKKIYDGTSTYEFLSESLEKTSITENTDNNKKQKIDIKSIAGDTNEITSPSPNKPKPFSSSDKPSYNSRDLMNISGMDSGKGSSSTPMITVISSTDMNGVDDTHNILGTEGGDGSKGEDGIDGSINKRFGDIKI